MQQTILQFLLNLKVHFNTGGWIMYPMLLTVLALWYFLGFRAYLLCVPLPKRFSSHGGASDRQIKKEGGSRFAVLAGRLRTLRAEHADNLGAMLEECVMPELAEIDRYGKEIANLVALAPLLGLLGTVSGMIATFSSLAEQTFAPQTGGIAAGISEALYATEFGLVIAVPGLVFGAFLRRRQQRVTQLLLSLKQELLTSNERGMSQALSSVEA